MLVARDVQMNKRLSVLFVCLCLGSSVFAADVVKVKLPAGAAATVNGVSITEKLLENNIRVNVQQGQQDSPELRRLILDELIARELLAQEAARMGLDKTAQAQDQFVMLRQGFMIDLVVNDYLGKNPVSDSDVRAEYDRQVALTADGAAAQQYSISQILLGSEADARAVLAALKGGQKFDDLARAKSVDASKEQGGNLGWVLPGQIMPAISNVMVNLSKGAVTQSPIQTQMGWHVLKVDDIRPFKVPSFEDSKNQIYQGLMQNKRLMLLNKVRETAKVIR
jgi:peptidyl-prolyl cis-trans isomerase C